MTQARAAAMVAGEASQERRHGCGGSKLGAQTWSRAKRRDLSAPGGEKACGMRSASCRQVPDARVRDHVCAPSGGVAWAWRPWGVSVTVGEQTRRADMVASEATQPVCSGEKKGHGAGSIPLGSQEVAPWTVFALSRPSELSAQCWVVFSHGTWKVDSGVSTLRALPKSHCCGCCTSPARTGLLCMYLTTFPRWRSSRIARS